jgi:hypothetical protein
MANSERARRVTLRAAMAANRSSWCSCCEVASFLLAGEAVRKSYVPKRAFLARAGFFLQECKRLLHRSHVQLLEAAETQEVEQVDFLILGSKTLAAVKKRGTESDSSDGSSSVTNRTLESGAQAQNRGAAQPADHCDGPVLDDQEIWALRETTSPHDDWLHRGPWLYDMDFHNYIRFVSRELAADYKKTTDCGRQDHIFRFDFHYLLSCSYVQKTTRTARPGCL